MAREIRSATVAPERCSSKQRLIVSICMGSKVLAKVSHASRTSTYQDISYLAIIYGHFAHPVVFPRLREEMDEDRNNARAPLTSSHIQARGIHIENDTEEPSDCVEPRTLRINTSSDYQEDIPVFPW
jgi:hypothetical protein